jgi:hypothetical protein
MRRISIPVAIAGFLCCCFILAQRTVANPQGAAPDRLASRPPTATADKAQVFRFHTVSIKDNPPGIGGEAYRILAPVGWRAEGGIIWKNAVSDPAAVWIRLIGPAGQEMGVLPPIPFIWNPSMFGRTYPPGSFYVGTEVQAPVMDPFQCIRRIVVPRYRRNLSTARVINQEMLPELAAVGRQKYPQYTNAVYQAGKVRFEYNDSGADVEEDVYVLTASLQFPVGTTVSTMWAPDEIRYSKAPKGTLDAQRPLFQTAMFSLRPNLQWWAKVQQISQQLAQQQIQASNAAVDRARQQQEAADRLAAASRSVARAGDQINSMIMKGYQDRQATMDRINQRWDRTIREVEVYHNPYSGENVELPSGYSSGWVNKSGEYLVTGSSIYNPNSESNGSWTRLEKINP